MPGCRKDDGLAAPGAGQFAGALGTGGRVVVRTYQQAGEWQPLTGDRREVLQRCRAPGTLHIGRCHQQGTAQAGQVLGRGAGSPVRDGDAAQAMGNQQGGAGVAGDAGIQRGDPVGAPWGKPVVLLQPFAARQYALPVALPMVFGRPLPARDYQITNRLIAHRLRLLCVTRRGSVGGLQDYQKRIKIYLLILLSAKQVLRCRAIIYF